MQSVLESASYNSIHGFLVPSSYESQQILLIFLSHHKQTLQVRALTNAVCSFMKVHMSLDSMFDEGGPKTDKTPSVLKD